MRPQDMEQIKAFLDERGIIKAWPAKRARQQLLLQYVSEKFLPGRDYAEREVNDILQREHAFNDLFLLRRGMVDAGFMRRTPDGRRYWRAQSPEEVPANE